jgi:hypothetical protein
VGSVSGSSIYYLSPTKAVYADAVAGCTAWASDAKLAVITSSAEQTFIDAIDGKNLAGYARWIGATRVNGAFAWNDGSALSYTNWASGQPDNVGGGENCLGSGRPGLAPGAWHDLNCITTSMYYLCERPTST